MSIEQVRTLLVSENKLSRSIVKTILTNMGFNNISIVEDCSELEMAMKNFQPDMMIFDSGYSCDEIYELIKKLRHSDFGINPFMTVIALSYAPTTEVVSGVMTSGVDDLLIQPYSAGQFVERLKVLIEDRKPFVVTSDYIGPDRRKKERIGEGEIIPLINVPNALQACFNNKMDREKFSNMVTSMSQEINLMRLDRNGVQVTWLVERILSGFTPSNEGALDPEVIGHLQRLEEVAIESGHRLKDTPFAHVTDICEALLRLAEKMLSGSEDITEKDKKLLTELSNAFRISFKEIDSSEIAKHILAETSGSIS